MLLQRASAGSGKTHKLAKTYIRLFISARDMESGRYILRSPEELRDKHSHILGVTFTNKATNEMKSRIVERLAALAVTHPEPGLEPAGYRFPAYLLDFTGEGEGLTDTDDIIYSQTGQPASRREITISCRKALNVLLNDYGHFNISTIDTFFQSILRTLAYELRLNDNYHVELNDEYLAQVGVDETLLSMKGEDEHSGYVREWTQEIIHERLERGESWNPFVKGAYSSGIYNDLLSLAKKMSLENFKLAIESTGEYFSQPERFRRFMTAVRRAASATSALRRDCLEAISELERGLTRMFGTDWKEMCQRGVETSLAKLRYSKASLSLSALKISNKILAHGTLAPQEASGKDVPFKKGTPAAGNPEAMALIAAVGDAAIRWDESAAYWGAVTSRLHYMGMLHDIRRNIDLFREENNIIPLSETNDILRGIIAGGENPFIYERIGTRLHHYLLDEFQDTSVMQWENLRPLLQESEGNGFDNLIIGDAKQSIYRFRNAEPELINSTVENEIAGTRVLPDSLTPGSAEYAAVNTNWRSSMQVVDFNNSLFLHLSSVLAAEIPAIARLYSNVVQEIRHKQMPGYVTLTFRAPANDKGKADPWANLGGQIDELRSRGYRLRDIAVLVNRNKEGQQAIASLMDYNRRMAASDTDWKPIEIISEESLKIGESVAVKVILSVLGLISGSYTYPDEDEGTNEGAESGRPRKHRLLTRHELTQMVANYHFFRARNPEADTFTALQTDAHELVPKYDIEQMLEQMPAVTLPALVEEIAARFVSEEMSAGQCAYIAALQDAVMEYCENYPSDISSFLNWWAENGDKLTIAAPEGTDALQIMTIHKSKGLEFEVVLIPKADWLLAPEKEENEIIWVKHTPRDLQLEDEADVPPLLPVTPDGDFMNHPDSPFYPYYKEYADRCATDQINKTYVAFTRAVRELHICAPVPKKTDANSRLIGNYLRIALNAINPAGHPGWNFDEEDGLVYGSPLLFTPRQSKSDAAIVIDRYCPPGHPRIDLAVTTE